VLANDESQSGKELTGELDVSLRVPDLLRALGERVYGDRSRARNCGGSGRCQKSSGDEADVMHFEVFRLVEKSREFEDGLMKGWKSEL
jgi:hypothetical protein